jgi:glycerol-3-phosphate dehydrogenase
MGSGNFGSCLADHLADNDHRVSIWCRSAEVAESFNQYHKNPKYLKDHIFPDTIEAIGPDMPESSFMEQMDVVLFAVPTQGLRCKHYAHPSMFLET